jgi:protein ImuB
VPLDDRVSLVGLCRQMLRELLAKAEHHGTGIQELEAELQTESGPLKTLLRLMKPTSDIEHLEQLLDLQLQRLAWSGGVTGVRWTARRLGPIEQVQGCWLKDDSQAENSRSLCNLIDRLSTRLGGGAVLRVEVVPDAQPECVARLVPCTHLAATEAEPFCLSPELSRGRPLRLLVQPLPIAVSSIVPDGPPVHLLWEGRRHDVIRVWGPERIATGWWRGRDVERDYYRAEWDDGTHAWVYCDRRADHWFLHGFFD